VENVHHRVNVILDADPKANSAFVVVNRELGNAGHEQLSTRMQFKLFAKVRTGPVLEAKLTARGSFRVKILLSFKAIDSLYDLDSYPKRFMAFLWAVFGAISGRIIVTIGLVRPQQQETDQEPDSQEQPTTTPAPEIEPQQQETDQEADSQESPTTTPALGAATEPQATSERIDDTSVSVPTFQVDAYLEKLQRRKDFNSASTKLDEVIATLGVDSQAAKCISNVFSLNNKNKDNLPMNQYEFNDPARIMCTATSAIANSDTAAALIAIITYFGISIRLFIDTNGYSTVLSTAERHDAISSMPLYTSNCCVCVDTTGLCETLMMAVGVSKDSQAQKVFSTSGGSAVSMYAGKTNGRPIQCFFC
jgi:hypothetical protein